MGVGVAPAPLCPPMAGQWSPKPLGEVRFLVGMQHLDGEQFPLPLTLVVTQALEANSMTAPDGTDAPPADDNVDDTVQPDAQVADADDDTGDDSGVDDKAASKIAKANREAQNLRARVKALEAIEKKYNDSEAAKLSELEKVQNALKAKDDELASLRINNFRRDAALSAGLTGDDIEFITGTTEEECSEQAKKLAKRLAASKPATDLRQGNRGATPAAPVDGNALIRQMAGHT